MTESAQWGRFSEKVLKRCAIIKKKIEKSDYAQNNNKIILKLLELLLKNKYGQKQNLNISLTIKGKLKSLAIGPTHFLRQRSAGTKAIPNLPSNMRFPFLLTPPIFLHHDQ